MLVLSLTVALKSIFFYFNQQFSAFKVWDKTYMFLYVVFSRKHFRKKTSNKKLPFDLLEIIFEF